MENEKIDVLELKDIAAICPKWTEANTKVTKYVITDVEGAEYWLDEIGASPERLVVANGWPTVTCSRHYRPIPHQTIESIFLEAVKEIWRIEGNPELLTRKYPNAPWRMVKVYGVEERVIAGHKVKLGVTITNSYDMSLGIHIDGFLMLPNNAGLFLGIGGSWRNNIRHYWSNDMITKRIYSELKKVKEGCDERLETIAFLDELPATEIFLSKLAKELGMRKREIEAWNNASAFNIKAEWGKNDGPKLTPLTDVSIWYSLQDFVMWAMSLYDWREVEVLRNLYPSIYRILRERETPKIPAPEAPKEESE